MNFAYRLATLGPIGFLPASGTVATLMTFPLVLIMQRLDWYGYAFVLAAITIAAFYAIKKALPLFAMPDPRAIVIDELVGTLVAFFMLPAMVPSVSIMVIVLFRLFDITKWCGVGYVENASGAWGVLLDDIVAGLLANIVVRGMLWILV